MNQGLKTNIFSLTTFVYFTAALMGRNNLTERKNLILEITRLVAFWNL